MLVYFQNSDESKVFQKMDVQLMKTNASSDIIRRSDILMWKHFMYVKHSWNWTRREQNYTLQANKFFNFFFTYDDAYSLTRVGV